MLRCRRLTPEQESGRDQGNVFPHHWQSVAMHKPGSWRRRAGRWLPKRDRKFDSLEADVKIANKSCASCAYKTRLRLRRNIMGDWGYRTLKRARDPSIVSWWELWRSSPVESSRSFSATQLGGSIRLTATKLVIWDQISWRVYRCWAISSVSLQTRLSLE